MNARPKKKLCWNCEGNVSLKAEICPYCGVSVVGLPSEMSSETPVAPYRLVNPSQESSIPISPYMEEDSESFEDLENEPKIEAEVEHRDGRDKDDTKKVVLVLALLLLGSVFLLFGFVLFLFSEQGYLTLHWHSGYWFVYLVLAIPLLFFGFRSLHTIQDKS